MGRIWRVMVVVAMACLGLGTMAAGAAAAHQKAHRRDSRRRPPHARRHLPQGARLDPRFGQGGSFTVKVPSGIATDGIPIRNARLAVAPSGKSYAQVGGLLMAFGADGRPDPTFGNHGRVPIRPGLGKVVEVSGVAVDSLGRVLVAGTYEPFPGFRNPIAKGDGEGLLGQNEPATEAFVIRYLPNSHPDPSFGDGGVVISSLGVPRPTNEPGEKPATAEYERPVVTVDGLEVDSQDRPVLSGSYVYAEHSCFDKQLYQHSIVARLTASGAVDTSFGAGGYAVGPGEFARGFAAGPNGEWALLGQEARACYRDIGPYSSRLAVFGETGTPSAVDPARPSVNAMGPMAVDSEGRVLYAEEEITGSEIESERTKITRLLPDGNVDTSFGFGGGIPLTRYAPARPAALAIDGKGRTVVGLSAEAGLELARLTPEGKYDGRFGDHNLLAGPKNGAQLGGVAIDSRGRILAAGTIFVHVPPRSEVENAGAVPQAELTVARFLPGR